MSGGFVWDVFHHSSSLAANKTHKSQENENVRVFQYLDCLWCLVIFYGLYHGKSSPWKNTISEKMFWNFFLSHQTIRKSKRYVPPFLRKGWTSKFGQKCFGFSLLFKGTFRCEGGWVTQVRVSRGKFRCPPFKHLHVICWAAFRTGDPGIWWIHDQQTVPELWPPGSRQTMNGRMFFSVKDDSCWGRVYFINTSIDTF